VQVKIAVVGEGTSRILEAVNAPELLHIAFTPSKVPPGSLLHLIESDSMMYASAYIYGGF